MIQIVALIGLGIMAGTTSGLIGIGGGIIIVPVLVMFFGYSQQMAQGTTLALMVPPIGAFAAWTYFRQGFVDVKSAMLICLGFIAGSVLGSDLAVRLPAEILTRTFGAILVAIGLKMLFLG